jgi:AraC-like DNA-binding protein
MDRSRHPTVWGRTLRAILTLAHAPLHTTEQALIAELGVAARVLAEPDARVPLEALYALLERCLAEDEHLPLRIARSMDIEAMDALGLLSCVSPDLGTALEVARRYQRIFSEGDVFEHLRSPRGLTIRFRAWGKPRPAHRAMADLFVHDMAVRLPALAARDIDGIGARLRRPAPPDAPAHAALLGIAPEYGAPFDEVVVPTSALALPIRSSHGPMARFLERFLDARMEQLPQGTSRVHAARCIEQGLGARRASLTAVARAMRMSPRTLQRRLADEGTTFDALLDRARSARALTLIDAGAALGEVAFALGYSEPSAFHRAFRRWTGTTPRAWRER